MSDRVGAAASAPERSGGKTSSSSAARESEPSAQRDEIKHEWPLFEVFVRAKRGLNHVHVGSLRAADPEMALHHARDLYTRRNEGVSIWVVRSDDVVASSPDAKEAFFAPSGDKVYRHPTYYAIPDSVPHI